MPTGYDKADKKAYDAYNRTEKNKVHGQTLIEERKRKQMISHTIAYILLSIIAVIFVLPLIYTVTTALKFPEDVAKVDTKNFFKNFVLLNNKYTNTSRIIIDIDGNSITNKVTNITESGAPIDPWYFNFFGKKMEAGPITTAADSNQFLRKEIIETRSLKAYNPVSKAPTGTKWETNIEVTYPGGIMTNTAVVSVEYKDATVTNLTESAGKKQTNIQVVKTTNLVVELPAIYLTNIKDKRSKLGYNGAFDAAGKLSLFGIKGAPKLPAFGIYYINSIIVSSTITLFQLITCSLAAYAFARLRWPGRDKIFLAYLGTLMVPGQVTMIPVFILFKQVGWVDTYLALILPGVFSAYGTFMLRQYFMSIPAALEEAAFIDGATKWQILFQIIIPLSKTALATLAIFVFLFAWNDFMWPLIVINKAEELKTLPIGLQAFQSQYTGQYHLIMAASLIVLVPVICLFIAGQKYITKGIMMTGLK